MKTTLRAIFTLVVVLLVIGLPRWPRGVGFRLLICPTDSPSTASRRTDEFYWLLVADSGQMMCARECVRPPVCGRCHGDVRAPGSACQSICRRQCLVPRTRTSRVPTCKPNAITCPLRAAVRRIIQSTCSGRVELIYRVEV